MVNLISPTTIGCTCSIKVSLDSFIFLEGDSMIQK